MGYTYDAENFKEIFEKNFTWLNGFMRNVRRFPDKTAMIDPLAEHRHLSRGQRLQIPT